MTKSLTSDVKLLGKPAAFPSEFVSDLSMWFVVIGGWLASSCDSIQEQQTPPVTLPVLLTETLRVSTHLRSRKSTHLVTILCEK